MKKKINCKKLYILLFIIFLFGNFKLNAAEIGTKYNFGLSFLGNYDYDEPNFMSLKSGYQATEDRFKNIGILFNYKNGFLVGGALTEFEIDTSYQDLTQTYWSNSSGTMTDIDTDIYNIRALYGIQMTENIMLKSGWGFRNLYHHWDGLTSTGSGTYDRVQDYSYVPIIAEFNAPISELKLDGKLKLEYGFIIDGKLDNKWNHLAGKNNKNTEMTNDKGYIWKASYEAKTTNFIFEPYYEFMSIDDSGVADGFLEPANITKEVGLRVKKEFNNNRKISNDFKKFGNNKKFYFGINSLLSEIDSGLSKPTGTAKIDEENTGHSIISGINIFDGGQKNPFNLNLEIAYNQFGKSYLHCKNGDTFTVDGRYQNKKHSKGTVLTCTSDLRYLIESYSTAVGIKPSINLPFGGLFVNANLGFHRWDQSELIGTSVGDWKKYYGIDSYNGLGLGIKKQNLEFGINYLDHKMYYDAKSLTANISYNF